MKYENLKFNNGYGGFDTATHEYVIYNKTPLPWINCISSVKGEPFGFLISEKGGGYVWHGNSRETPITRWYCDPADDPTDERLSITVYSPSESFSFFPFEKCVARHGFGYSIFEGLNEFLCWKIYTFVPIGTPVKITILEITAVCDTEISIDYSVDTPYEHSLYLSKDVDHKKVKKDDCYKFVMLLAKNESSFGVYTQIHACEDAFCEIKTYWHEYLGRIKIKTPDESLNVIMNGWLQYQTVSCRLKGRTAFYQRGGAYGFRDQLQDCLAILYTDPKTVKETILLHASRQYEEGDVQHWWHPPKNSGIRSRYSDDLLWLVYITFKYIEATGDSNILNVQVPYIKSKPLDFNEVDRYETPEISEKKESLYNHCLLACQYAQQYGEHGIPLIRGGDWNDGMNRVGLQGKGESIWLGWFLCACLKLMGKGSLTREAEKIASAIEKNAWDGSWYIRAFCDNGEVIGSSHSGECMIDSIAQSWAVLSGFGDATRCKKALLFAERFLADYENGIVKLLTPPFSDESIEKIGYIASYPPGVRENGAQYTHAAVWLAKAFLKMGRHSAGAADFTEKGRRIIDIINPVNHTRTALEVSRYKTEPYVVAADVYSNSNVGRGGWSWYTGSASWLYNTILEDILGFTVKNCVSGKAEIVLNPKISSEWNEFSIEYKYKSSTYNITINKKARFPRTIALVDDGKEHEVLIKK